jgi:RsiW-degrading membrane proteinase PrsW (M82 family)
MSGIWILVILVLASSIPAIAVYLWFRIARYPLSTVRFLLALLTGAAAFFPALILQNLFPPNFAAAGRWALWAQMFIRIAFTEELGRLLVIFGFIHISRRIDSAQHGGKKIAETFGQGTAPSLSFGGASSYVKAPESYMDVIYGSGIGLVAGLGFAILESAAYGAAAAGIVLIRLFTAAPLHAACGARVGAAAIMSRSHPAQAILRFFSAIAIHGLYNFMISIPGIPSLAAILIALSALASSILTIHSGIPT